MMRNKIHLKRYLIVSAMVFIVMFSLFQVMNRYEYKSYNDNYNKMSVALVLKIRENYPDISDDEIIAVLNSISYDESDSSLFEKYGIYPDEDIVLLANNNIHYRYLIFKNIIFIATTIILLFIFLKYDYGKNREIDEITKYIEQINRKNYALDIDDISEDELSILKNEVYKTTIMLKESAENSLKSKRELKKSLEDISHQLKTPLTSIMVILDNIIDDPDMDSNTRTEFIRDIKREVGNINFLVQTILKLSKLDSDTIRFVKEKRLLKELVDEAVKNVSALCDLKNIRTDIKGDGQSYVNCDFMWQSEAVTNIIRNCVDHSKEDSVLEIRYEQNQVYSMITVRDFGEGIDREDLPNIFKRFYKGKNATQDSVGIGLALAKTIIEEDNGTVSVTSDDTGTTFVIKYF